MTWKEKTKYELLVKGSRVFIHVHVSTVVVTSGVFFLQLLQTLFLKKWKYPFIKVICHPRNSIYIATHFRFFLKMSLSYKHIKIVTQLKISIQKSNNKHIFVVKFKHMDITNFNNLKKKFYELSIHWKRPQNQQM